MSVIRVLVVSTADRCRGPAAEALMRDRLGSRVRELEVWSAGTAADGKAAVHPLTIEALGHVGVRVRAGRSRRLLADDVRGADLVLCAERMHRLYVARLSAGAAAKAFTMAEFARLSSHLHEAAFAEMLAEAAALRAAHPADHPGDDDLADPVNGDHLDHARILRRLDYMVAPIAKVLSVAASRAAPQHGRRARLHPEHEVLLPPEATARL